MKKFGLLVIGGVAVLILLANLGPFIGLIITAGIGYLVVREFIKATTTGAKFGWGFLAFIIACIIIANIPSLLAVVAVFVLYVVFKKWNESNVIKKQDDPFESFEKEWANLNK